MGSMDDAGRRHDEAEALAAIFGPDFAQASPLQWRFCCPAVAGALTLDLPEDYPSCSPPNLILDIPGRGDLLQLRKELDSLYIPDEEIGYTMCEQFCTFCMEAETSRQNDVADAIGSAGGNQIMESAAAATKTANTKMTKAERRMEEKARRLAEAAMIEERSFGEEESLLDKYGDAHAAGVEAGWLQI